MHVLIQFEAFPLLFFFRFDAECIEPSLSGLLPYAGAKRFSSTSQSFSNRYFLPYVRILDMVHFTHEHVEGAAVDAAIAIKCFIDAVLFPCF